jgi:hypothetical protein
MNTLYTNFMENTPNLSNKRLMLLDFFKKILPQAANWYINKYQN